MSQIANTDFADACARKPLKGPEKSARACYARRLCQNSAKDRRDYSEDENPALAVSGSIDSPLERRGAGLQALTKGVLAELLARLAACAPMVNQLTL